MRVPISWLRQYVPVSVSPKELAHRLTMAGIEVDEIDETGGNWDRDNVVVGHVLKVDRHPNADRLSLPTVDIGNGETATVVCGAPNVAAGQKIAFAREGAQLFSPRSGKVETLKAANIRGVESAGMVCSSLELQLGEDHDGILVLDDDAPVGTPLVDYLGDAVLDIDVTPNRPDCLSILGVAHEVAALTGAEVTEPDLTYPEEGAAIESLVEAHGILVPHGFGSRGAEGKIHAIQFAREHEIPFFGICYGLQCAVTEAARNLAGLAGANSAEVDAKTPHPVIDFMPDQREQDAKGGTMRLGAYPCRVIPDTLAARAYGATEVSERHRHRYEFNPEYRERLEAAGMVVSGVSPDDKLVEIVELPSHPWFLACQFHPEFKSNPFEAHPLFRSFIGAVLRRKRDLDA